MFKGAKILKDEVMTDVDVLSDYINTHLGGNVGAEYANVSYRITCNNGNQRTLRNP